MEAALDGERQLRARAEAQLSSFEVSAKAVIVKLEAQLVEASATHTRLHKAGEESKRSHLSQMEELKANSQQMVKEAREKILRLEAEVNQRSLQHRQVQTQLSEVQQQQVGLRAELSQQTISIDELTAVKAHLEEQTRNLGREVQQRITQCVQLNERLDRTREQLEGELEAKRFLNAELEKNASSLQEASIRKLEVDREVSLLRGQVQEAQLSHQLLKEEFQRARVIEEEHAAQLSVMRSEKAHVTQELASVQVPPLSSLIGDLCST